MVQERMGGKEVGRVSRDDSFQKFEREAED